MSSNMLPLPPFRRDLKIYMGPEASDGSPTYTVFDPVREEYFKAPWAIATIMKTAKEGMTSIDLIEALKKNTTLRLTEEELQAFYRQAQSMGLLAIPKASEHLEDEATKEKVGWFQQLIFNYLFFRIPLFNPDPFLTRTYPTIAPLFTSKAMGFYGLIIMWGLSILAINWEMFISTFTYFFNLQGFISYVLALSLMKIIHEFSHAYTAKKYGLRVPSMGVALLVLFPVLYTDVTDAWRLRERRKRLAITGAGVMAELVIAGFALIFWAFLSPGILQSLCFVIASANLLHTLAINLNPAMRFDGYYILSDMMGVENLQTRAFIFLRRSVYSFLFDLHLPWPDSSIRRSTGAMMTLYAAFTALYRVFLYTAIALFIYHEFTKILGVILFLVEIAIFFVWPVVYETSLILKIRHLLTWNIRTKMTTGILAVFLLWVFIPFPHQHSFSAVTLPSMDQEVYVPHAGRLVELKVKRGEQVKADQVLVVIETPMLTTKLAGLQEDKKILDKKLAIIGQKEEYQPFYLEKQAELGSLDAQIAGMQDLLKQNVIKAIQAGVLYEWDNNLRVGEWLAENQVLGHVAAIGAVDVISYLPERYLDSINKDQKVTFRLRSTGDTIEGVVKEIAPIRAVALSQLQLASIYGGDLPVRDVNKNLVLLESYFTIKVELKGEDKPRFGEVGVIVARTGWTTIVGDFFRWFVALLEQESKL